MQTTSRRIKVEALRVANPRQAANSREMKTMQPRLPVAITGREWLYLASQVALIPGIVLGDDVVHAWGPRANAAAALANALKVEHFEYAHRLWIEPAIQSFFAHTHHIFGQVIGWAQITPIVDALYGEGHVFFTLAFAIWVFIYRRGLFSFLRNIFLITNVFAILIYEKFPLAPPRLAIGLRWDGRPYHFLDAVFGGHSALKIGFNQYAAMPSVHVAWAVIVGLTLAWAARPLPIRLLGLAYPVVMLTTVIVTGNHYLLDGLSAFLVVLIATVLSFLFTWWRARTELFIDTFRRLQRLRQPSVGRARPVLRPSRHKYQEA